MKAGQTVSSVESAITANPVAKALLPEVHTLLKLFYTIPLSAATCAADGPRQFEMQSAVNE